MPRKYFLYISRVLELSTIYLLYNTLEIKMMRKQASFMCSLRDRPEIPQVLFVFPKEKWGEGGRTAGNRKLEEIPEENRGAGIKQ